MSDSRVERVVCVRNDGFAASLTIDEAYDCQLDSEGAKHGLIRVIDNTGEGLSLP